MTEKEQKRRERLKASYEANIQQLKQKTVPDFIEMASEIAAVKLIYEERSAEDDTLHDYTGYLPQFGNPLQMVKDNWLGGHLSNGWQTHFGAGVTIC